jgi:hypothetical protein
MVARSQTRWLILGAVLVAAFGLSPAHAACEAPSVLLDGPTKLTTTRSGPTDGTGVRVRRDRIDKNGKVTLRHRTRLHHIGVGHAHKGKRVTLLVHGLDVRVISEEGELIRHLTLDPSRDYQPQAS